MPAAEWFEFSSFSPRRHSIANRGNKQIRRACEAVAVRATLYVDWPSDPVAAEGADLV